MKRLFATLVLLFLLAALAACGDATATTPTVAAPTSIPLPTDTPVPTATPTVTPTPSPEPSPTFTPTPAPVCGDVREMNILVVGAYPGLYDPADAIRIVHVDFVNLQVIVIPLPRDLKVTLPESAPYQSPVKLNSAYTLGTPYYVRNAPREGGAKQLQATIEQNFGITTDRFLVVSGRGFARFIDAIGGIPVYLPYPIQDQNTHANFKAGSHWFTGSDALKLARIRMDSNDFVRIQRQSWLLQGILKSLAQKETLSKIPQILEALQALYITDLTPDDITRFTCLLGLMVSQQHQPVFLEVPQEILTQTRAPVYNVLTLAPKGQKAKPTYAFVLEWDDTYTTWLQQALRGEIQP